MFRITFFMDQHAIPRQITTFEFKLIGFLTLKQFGYLVLFAGAAVLVYFLTPVAIVNIIAAVLVFGVGAVFAYVKYNERSLDIWIKNLFTRLFSPSQYRYHKKNAAPAFLDNVVVYADPAIAATHLDARQKLAAYTGPSPSTSTHKQEIHNLIHQAPAISPSQLPPDPALPDSAAPVTVSLAKNPFVVGVVKNNKETALPNIMIYVKDPAGKTVRILKTNSHGVFASYHPLPSGSYLFEPKDLGSRYFFDTMNLALPQENKSPLTIYSKEII